MTADFVFVDHRYIINVVYCTGFKHSSVGHQYPGWSNVNIGAQELQNRALSLAKAPCNRTVKRHNDFRFLIEVRRDQEAVSLSMDMYLIIKSILHFCSQKNARPVGGSSVPGQFLCGYVYVI